MQRAGLPYSPSNWEEAAKVFDTINYLSGLLVCNIARNNKVLGVNKIYK